MLVKIGWEIILAEEYKQKIWGNCLENRIWNQRHWKTAFSSFQTSEIVPFNSDIVLADEYIDPGDNISIAITLTDGDTKIPTNEISICDQSQSNKQITCTSDNIAGIIETSTNTQTMENNKTTENQVSFEIEMTSKGLNKSVEKKNVSFEEILKSSKIS